MSGKITFILNEPRNPKNIGASARGMANFGFRNLAVVHPYSVAWRETRSAVNASPVVEKAKKYSSLKTALRSSHLVIGTSAGSRRNLPVKWMGLEELQKTVSTRRKAGQSVALVFGSERSGLSNKDLAFCHAVLRIPTDPECPSMNLSQAVAVVACALRQVPQAPRSAKGKPTVIPVKHREHLIAHALKASAKAGLLRVWDKSQREIRVRQSFTRWNLSPADAAFLHSIFGWILRQPTAGSAK